MSGKNGIVGQFLLAVSCAVALGGCAGIQQGTSPTEPTKPAGGISVTPSAVSIRGGGSQQFGAQDSENSTAAFAWSVNGVAGGNATTGTISAAGLYTAPEFPPTANVVSVTATEPADSTKSATAAVTLQNPVPQITSLAPTSIPVGSFKLTINGAHFATNAVVSFGVTALTTTRVSSTQLTATGTATASQVGTIAVMVKNPDPGTTTSSTVNAQVTNGSGVSVAITPAKVSVHLGDKQAFQATVAGNTNTAVTWKIAPAQSSSTTADFGSIDGSGNYLAPGVLPPSYDVTVTATSQADTTKTATATISLINPLPVATSVTPSTLGTGPFMVSVTGKGFVPGSIVKFAGTALSTTYVSPTELDAVGTIASTMTGSQAIAVSNPAPGQYTSQSLTVQVVSGGSQISQAAAVRFLEQSSFGPTIETVNQLQQTGFDTYLQSQFAIPASAYPTPAATDTGLGNVQKAFFANAVNDSDQLRQRVAFALNELWVVSNNKVSDPTGYTNYMAVLTNDSLGNYYNVMKDVTVTPAMGHFLDMVNNDAPAAGQHANENYARELMQLFTLGLSQVNPDGTPIVDGTGTPIPTYTQDDVMALGRSFTGWTYPTQPGKSLAKHNPSYYGGNMAPYESNHDTGAKTFLGQSISAGQSAEQELDAVLTVIFNHPNLPPFVAKQLIEKLVTSNPSPQYIARVATAFTNGKFNSYGGGKRGDMQATVAAILLDPEARRGDDPTTAVATDGKLREPVILEVSIARAFHAKTDGSGFVNYTGNMSENLFNSPSVFNFFPPDSLVPGTTLNGPEFAIYNTNTSFARINFINSIVYGSISSTTTLDFTPVINAGSQDNMIAWLNSLFLHGTMSDSMKSSIETAVAANNATDTKNQAKTAIYLVLSSSQYQIQR